MITISTISGTYVGDPNDQFIDIDTTVTGNSIVVDGTYSNLGTIYNVTGSFTMPAPSASTSTYVSLQLISNGTVQMYTSTTAMPTLQSGNLIQLYSEVIPQNATNDEGFTNDTEPSLD